MIDVGRHQLLRNRPLEHLLDDADPLIDRRTIRPAGPKKFVSERLQPLRPKLGDCGAAIEPHKRVHCLFDSVDGTGGPPVLGVIGPRVPQERGAQLDHGQISRPRTRKMTPAC
jgi:hypothetical protein